jgi:porin
VARIVFTTVIFITTLLLLNPLVHGQTPTPTPGADKAAVEKVKPAEVTSNTSSKPSPTPEPDFWTQETMTGDWGGTRSRWKEEGVELEFKSINFYQGIASGGTNNNSAYNGKFETTWKFDLGKLYGWKFWSSEIKAEVRFGKPVLTGTGGINIVNTAAIVPGASGDVVSVTAVNFTRIIPKDLKKGDLYVFSFGRYNLLDLLDEDFLPERASSGFLILHRSGH